MITSHDACKQLRLLDIHCDRRRQQVACRCSAKKPRDDAEVYGLPLTSYTLSPFLGQMGLTTCPTLYRQHTTNPTRYPICVNCIFIYPGDGDLSYLIIYVPAQAPAKSDVTELLVDVKQLIVIAFNERILDI